MRKKKIWQKIIYLLVGLFFMVSQEGYGMDPSSIAPSSTDSSSLLTVGIEGYQNFLSPVLDSKCYMFPSCSVYAQQALDEYGPFFGVLLIIDRLFREADEAQTSPLIKQGNSFKLFDPPSANLWWKKN